MVNKGTSIYTECCWHNYRCVPHKLTGEKTSFLLFSVDCRSPTEAALLPAESVDIDDYRQELIYTSSNARELAVSSIQAAQVKYKKTYDQSTRPLIYQIQDWVLIQPPAEETGQARKSIMVWPLSC